MINSQKSIIIFSFLLIVIGVSCNANEVKNDRDTGSVDINTNTDSVSSNEWTNQPENYHSSDKNTSVKYHKNGTISDVDVTSNVKLKYDNEDSSSRSVIYEMHTFEFYPDRSIKRIILCDSLGVFFLFVRDSSGEVISQISRKYGEGDDKEQFLKELKELDASGNEW